MKLANANPSGVQNFDMAPIFLEYLLTLPHLRYRSCF